MQTSTDKAKPRKRRFPIVLILLLILFVAAGAYYWFFMRPAGWVIFRERSYSADYPAMPTNSMGNNSIGNLPENAQAGGFMAGQDGWIYFANFADNGALYMCHEGGGKMVKITNFPVANINVMADTIVFTSLEQCVVKRPDGLYTVEFDSVNGLLRDIQHAVHAQYGGKLYAVTGLRFGGKLDLTVIDSENIYFSPVLTEHGLFALCPQEKQLEYQTVSLDVKSDNVLPTPMAFGVLTRNTDSARYSAPGVGLNLLDAPPDSYIKFNGEPSAIAEKMSLTVSPVGQPGEYMIKQFVRGGTMYAEMCRYDDPSATGRILRIDLETLQPIDSMPGHDLYKRGESFVFINPADGFIYEIGPDGNQVNPISVRPVTDMIMNQQGEITARLDDGGYLALSPVPMYTAVESVYQRVLRGEGYMARQNGWYNYINPNDKLLENPPAPGFFKAGENYYRAHPDGLWVVANEPAEWLNRTPSLDPAAPKADFLPALEFVPPWDMGDENDAALAEESEPRATDGKQDATLEPDYALEATIMLMTENDAVKDKYSAESIDSLKKYYGGALSVNPAIDEGAAKLEEYFNEQLGASPSKQELATVLRDWFLAAEYRVGTFQTTGDTAKVNLSISNVTDSKTLSSALESEIAKRAAKSPMMLLWPRERQLEWVVGIFMEIARDPKQYGAISESPIETTVTMRNLPGAGWVAENPGEMHSFFQSNMS